MAFRLTHEGATHEVEIVRRRPHLVLRLDGREHEIAAISGGAEGRDAMEVDGNDVAFVRARAGDRQFIFLAGQVHDIAFAEASTQHGEQETLDDIRSPMPGRIVAVLKSVGETVARGETLMIVESMKLQLSLPSPREGTVAALSRGVGENVDKDEIVARLEAAIAGA